MHPVAPLQQALRQRRADKACRTGDEYVHVSGWEKSADDGALEDAGMRAQAESPAYC
jgi:hypothetical protein